jgi:FkbM family methyltransferase
MNDRPSLIQRIAASIERRAQKMQGKGAGGHSVEAEVRTALAFLPREGAVVLDIGANKGLWSRAMLREAGDRLATIIAFEPSRHNWSALEAISDPRFSLVRQGVADQNGAAELHMDEPGSGLASLSKRNLDHVGLEMREHEIVELTTLDTYVAAHGLTRIDFMKLDIEGHELSALQGAERLLKSRAIQALSFEFGGSNIDTRTFFRDFWHLLGSYGFTIWRIVPGGAPVKITSYHERLECFATTNFIAKLEG